MLCVQIAPHTHHSHCFKMGLAKLTPNITGMTSSACQPSLATRANLTIKLSLWLRNNDF